MPSPFAGFGASTPEPSQPQVGIVPQAVRDYLAQIQAMPSLLQQMKAHSDATRALAQGPGGWKAAMTDPGLSASGANIAGNFDFTGPVGGMAGMLLDARQLARPRGKIDAAYPPWGMTDFMPGSTPRNVTIYKNPSPHEIDRLKARSDLRVVMSKDGGELYAWPAEDALHPEVADDVFSPSRVKDEKTGVVTNNYRQGWIYQDPK